MEDHLVLLQVGAAHCSEEDEGLAFLLVGNAHDGNVAVGISGVKVHGTYDGDFELFVRNHFSCNFGKAGDSAFNMEKPVFIHMADVPCFKPAVLKNFAVVPIVAEVAVEDVGSFEPDHACFIKRVRVVMCDVCYFYGNPGEGLPDGTQFLAGDKGFCLMLRGSRDICGTDGGGFGKSVALHWVKSKFFGKGMR